MGTIKKALTHCKKNFWDSLEKYQKKTGCTEQTVGELYQEFKKILDQSTSKSNLLIRLKALEKRKECDHPLLKNRLKELKENAAHYTMHNKRKGISTTTFAVDNYLKIVKRKLRHSCTFILCAKCPEANILIETSVETHGCASQGGERSINFNNKV